VLYHFGGAIQGALPKLGNKRKEIRVSATVFDDESVRWLLTHFMTSIKDVLVDQRAAQVKCLLCHKPTTQACMGCREASGMPAALCWSASSGKLCFRDFHLMPAEERQSILHAARERAGLTWAEPDPFYRLEGGAAASCIASAAARAADVR